MLATLVIGGSLVGTLTLLISAEWVIWREWSRHRAEWIHDGRPAMRKFQLIPKGNFGANTRVLLECLRRTPAWAIQDRSAYAGVLLMRLGAVVAIGAVVMAVILFLTTPRVG